MSQRLDDGRLWVCGMECTYRDGGAHADDCMPVDAMRDEELRPTMAGMRWDGQVYRQVPR